MRANQAAAPVAACDAPLPQHVPRHPRLAPVPGALLYDAVMTTTLTLLDPAGPDREALTDPTPLFDLRVAERFRGRGLGVEILTALTRHVFETMPDVDRFEGQTREDNSPMLRTFQRAGWVKEAHYRRGWPVEGGEPVASVAYAMLRQDWENGTTTPVPWE